MSFTPNPVRAQPYDPNSAIPMGTILAVIDGIPETRGMGCIVLRPVGPIRLRSGNAAGASVVIELRPPAAADAAGPAPRGPSSSAPREWLALGLNCGGAVLGWVGVVGLGALSPVTGGASSVGAAFLWGGALAASAQCVASGYRVTNTMTGRESVNAALDQDETYVWTMRGLDVVGLVGAGGAIKEVKATSAALDEAGIGWSEALGPLNRNQRLRLTEGLELQGARRVAAVSINAVVKQRLLDGIGAAMGFTGSATSGVVADIVVWVVSGDR